MTSAIIVAAGKGTRMGSGMGVPARASSSFSERTGETPVPLRLAQDKLFLEVGGCPVVAHTWRRFDSAKCIDEIVLVVRDEMRETFTELSRQFNFSKPFRFATGGKERQDSVWNGLQALADNCDIVAIQDAARPCTSESLIEATIAAARSGGAAVAAQAITDTIKESSDGKTIAKHLDRSRLWAVQTPQTFRVEIIRRALAAVREKNLHVTDDTAACELIGQPVQLVSDRAPNPKITVPEDLFYIESVLKRAIDP